MGDARHQDRMNTRVLQQGEPGGSRHPLRPSGNGRLGPGCQRPCNLLRLGTRSHLVLLALCLGRGRLAWRPTHPPSGPAVQTPQMDLGQGGCLCMSGVDRELEEGALGRRPHAATAAHTADPAEWPRAGRHLDGPTGSPAGRSLPHDHGRASAHTPPPTQTPPQAPVVAARGPAARPPGRAGHRRGWPAVPQGRRRP
jgi:hypothetical protein